MYIYWVSGETGSSGADSLCQASQWRGLLAVREAGHWDLLGYFPKTKNQLKNQKKNSKISIWAFFLVFSELLQTHHTYKNQRTTNTKPIDMMTMMMYEHCAGCSLARYCGQLCQHKVETKAYFQFSTNPTLYLGSHLFQKRLCWGKIHKWSRNFLLNTQGTVVKNKKIKTNNLWSVWQ